jgi:carboxypeptidase C (cathepsin A)
MYPEFKTSKFFITGESYAGIYMSMLMGEIMNRGGVDNLVGAAIGNGCTGNKVGVCAFGGPDRSAAVAQYYYGGGFISKALMGQIQSACAGKNNWSGAACAAATSAMHKAGGALTLLSACPIHARNCALCAAVF